MDQLYSTISTTLSIYCSTSPIPPHIVPCCGWCWGGFFIGCFLPQPGAPLRDRGLASVLPVPRCHLFSNHYTAVNKVYCSKLVRGMFSTPWWISELQHFQQSALSRSFSFNSRLKVDCKKSNKSLILTPSLHPLDVFTNTIPLFVCLCVTSMFKSAD